MKKILIVGQTPPPYGGQAVMIQHLLNHEYEGVKLFHVRMAFSRGMRDMGKFQFYKFFHLICIISKIYYYRIFKGVKILYYPPSGPTSAAFRDIAILFPTRWMFSKTIFHFHASGLSTHIGKHGYFFDFLFKRCFFRPDIAIRLSQSCPDEGLYIMAQKNVIIPNGMPDEAEHPNAIGDNNRLRLIFMGLLERSKGEFDLLEAVNILVHEGLDIHLQVAGEFKSPEYREEYLHYIKENQLDENVEYWGIIRDEKKKSFFRNADVFCFPSYFHSESFPLVLIEAMSYGLPIIATNWRGIPDMVKNGYNGLFVEIQNPQDLAGKIKMLLSDKELRNTLSTNARKEFDEKYSLIKHLELIEEVFKQV